MESLQLLQTNSTSSETAHNSSMLTSDTCTHPLPLSASPDHRWRKRVCVCARHCFSNGLADLIRWCQAAGVHTPAHLLARLSRRARGGGGVLEVMVKESWPPPWEICSESLSERKQALKLADSFFIWHSPRCGGVWGREGEREMGGGAGDTGRAGVGGLGSCYEQNAVNREQTQFQAQCPRGEAHGPSTSTAKWRPLTSSLLHAIFVASPSPLPVTPEPRVFKVSWRSVRTERHPALFHSICLVRSRRNTFLALRHDQTWKWGRRGQMPTQRPRHAGEQREGELLLLLCSCM